MMNKERLTELIVDFKNNGINHDSKNPRFNLALEYQDIIGRANKADLQDFEKDLPQDMKRLFIWCNNSCLSIDMSIDIIKDTMIRRWRHKVVEDIEAVNVETEKEISDKWFRFQECKKSIFKRINFLKSHNDYLIDQNKAIKQQRNLQIQEIKSLKRQVRELQEKANKYDSIKSLLS